MTTRLIDSYVHKTVEHRRRNASLKLLTSQSLFSSSVVDVGTNLLLRVITAQADHVFETCLDLGCGYGPLGLSLAASGIATNVEMVDRDALAVDFARLNATENGVTNASTHSGLGLDDASGDFYDLIVSNLPGKAGSRVLRHFLSVSSLRLKADGEFWGVVVNPLWPEIDKNIEELDVNIVHVEKGPRHTAFGFRNTGSTKPQIASDSMAEIYGRATVDFTVGRQSYGVETARGVNEFEGLGYTTRLLLEQLYTMRNKRWGEAVVFNVSQGYVPIAMRASGMTDALRLVDRDLLALRTAGRNLQINRLDSPTDSLHHQVSWLLDGRSDFSLVVGALRGDEPRLTLEISAESIVDSLRPGGLAVVAARSTPITRMLKVLQARKDVHVLDRNRYRGSSVVTLRKVD